MSELTVEPVESVDEVHPPTGVDAPEYVLYGGKGGVGKTTCAAATALASARDGTATLVVSTDPAHSLSDTLGTDVPAEPTRIDDEDPLYAVEIDPEAASDGPFAAGAGGFGAGADGSSHGAPADGRAHNGPAGNGPADYGPFDEAEGGQFDVGDGSGDEGLGGLGDLGDSGGLGGLGSLLGGEHPLAGGPMPGADEAAALQLLLEYLDDPRFDRVVVDTAPTGHTLRLLELPDVMDSMVGRLLAFRERLSGLLSGVDGLGDVFGGSSGGGASGGGTGRREPGEAGGADPEPGIHDLRELSERLERLRAALRDPEQTDFRVVTVPEELSVVEAERLVRRLDAFDIPVRTVVVNRVSEDLADVTGLDAEWFVAPDTEHCEFCRRRWAVQRDALERAQELFRGRAVKRVPLFAEPVHGAAMLGVVAACLE